MSEADDEIAEKVPAYEIDGDGRTVVPLHYPVSSGSEQIDEVRIRRIKGKDHRQIDGLSGGKQTLKLISLLCGLTDPVIDKLDDADIQVITEVIEGFQKAGRKTGKPAS